MTPTNKLRFVERTVRTPVNALVPDITMDKTIRVLQQQWVNDLLEPTETEWRDVPLEAEGVDDEERRREKERLMSGIL